MAKWDASPDFLNSASTPSVPTSRKRQPSKRHTAAPPGAAGGGPMGPGPWPLHAPRPRGNRPWPCTDSETETPADATPRSPQESDMILPRYACPRLLPVHARPSPAPQKYSSTVAPRAMPEAHAPDSSGSCPRDLVLTRLRTVPSEETPLASVSWGLGAASTSRSSWEAALRTVRLRGPGSRRVQGPNSRRRRPR